MGRNQKKLEGPSDVPGDWYYTLEAPTVTAFERSDKGNRIYVRWWYNNSETKRRGRWKKFALRTEGLRGTTIGTIRNERGKIPKTRRETVIQALRKVQNGLTNGTIDSSTGQFVVEQRNERVQQAHFTLAQGRAAIFDNDTGLYLFTGDGERDQNVREMLRAQRFIERQWGSDTPYSKLPQDMARAIWRKIARSGSPGSGKRNAARFVGYIHRSAKWLASQGHIAPEHAPYLDGWYQEFIQEWERLTGASVQPERKRHSEDELERLLAHLNEAEPRLRLMMLSGMELRLGQVRRSMRSDLDLSEKGPFGLGTLRVVGAGKKKGAEVHLDPEQRAAFDYEMNLGYLRQCEKAYQAGRIQDYSLFPQGRFRDGAIPVRKNEKYLKPVAKTSVLGWFKSLEKLAGIQHVPGRAWYGVRRITTDLAPAYTTDSRVLDALGGWSKGSKMREQIYQDEQREDVARAAADTRYRMRQGRTITPGARELHAQISSLLDDVEEEQTLRFVLAAVAKVLAHGPSEEGEND